MTCENNIMGSKNKSTKGMLLSVGMWMMISYSTFYASERPPEPKIENNLEDKIEKLEGEIPKNEEEIKHEELIDENKEFIEQKPEERENEEEEIILENEQENEKENAEKLIPIKEKITEFKIEGIEGTASPSEIIYKVLSESKELKECIKDIEKNKSEEFKVKYAGCCCDKGNLLNAEITDKQKKYTMAVKDIVSQVLIDNDKSLELTEGKDTMAKKTNIYTVLANTIKTINEVNEKKNEEKEKLDEELNLESLDPHQKHDEQNLEFKEQNLENRDPNLKYNEGENEQEEIEEEEKKEEDGGGGEPQKKNNEEEKNEEEEPEEEEVKDEA